MQKSIPLRGPPSGPCRRKGSRSPARCQRIPSLLDFASLAHKRDARIGELSILRQIHPRPRHRPGGRVGPAEHRARIGVHNAPDADAEEATRLGPSPTLIAQASLPTVLSGRPSRQPTTWNFGTTTRRSHVFRLAAGFAAGLFVFAAASLVLLRGNGRTDEAPLRPAAPAPKTPAPGAATAPLPALVPAPSVAIPAPSPSPAAAPVLEERPASRPAPEPPASRPVTVPERLTPEPPFGGEPPAGCSGVAVTVGFAIDAHGGVVSPRLFPSEASPECGRFVLEALPGWKWRPAVDASGAPVPSARLVALIRLP